MGGQGGREPADAWGSGADVPGSEGAPPLPPKTSGLAIASLVLGILGIVSCGLASIPGLILGIVSLVRIRRSRGALGGRGFAIAGTIVSVVFILLGFLGALRLARALGGVKVIVQAARCSTNLHFIGTGIAAYKEASGGQLPDGLEDLWPEHLKSPDVLLCPADQEPMTIGEDLKCSYHYVGPISLAAASKLILVYEKEGNHVIPGGSGSQISGRGVLFADGRVEFLSEDDFQARLRESLELVKQADWDSYSPERRAEIEAFYTYRPPR
jgi:hypothetical protein